MEGESPEERRGEQRRTDDSTTSNPSPISPGRNDESNPSPLSPGRNDENGSRRRRNDENGSRRRRTTRIRIGGPIRDAPAVDTVDIIEHVIVILAGLTEEVPSVSSGQNRRRADRAAVEHLHHIQISEDHIRNTGSCPVCLRDFKLGEEACHLHCGHIHHPTCILRWLESGNTCPLCRFQVPLWLQYCYVLCFLDSNNSWTTHIMHDYVISCMIMLHWYLFF